MRFEMKCDDAFEAMSAGLDGELGDTERPRLRHHLAGCDRCRARDAEIRAVHRQMRSALRASLVRPPEHLRLRVQRDCTPIVPRFSAFAFGIALTGAGALGALLALAFRPAAPVGDAEMATREPVDPHAGRATLRGARPRTRDKAPEQTAVLTGRTETRPAPTAESVASLPSRTPTAPAPLAVRTDTVAAPGRVTPPAAPAAGPVAPADTPAPAAAAPGGSAGPGTTATETARAAAAASDCGPPPSPPILVQLEAPPQPAAPETPAVHASVAACGLNPAVVTALTGQAIQVQNTGSAARQIQIDQPPSPGAEFTEGDRQNLPVGASVVRSFERPGLYPVWCDGSSQPCGYLAVAAHPQFDVVEESPPAGRSLAVRFTGAASAPGPRPVAVYQSRRRAVAASLNLDAYGAGRLRLDPAAGALPLAALALNDCRLVRDRQSPVAHACARGGIKEAKKAMKSLIKRARDRGGVKFECDSCHRNETDWQLTDDARANFNSMLAAAGT